MTIDPARARTRIRVRALPARDRDRVEANARLTATTAVVLLVLFAAELATVLLGARSVLTAHVVVGLILVPPVLLKIASTTWRMLAYYRGDAAYRERGAPPLALRILGPFFVFLTALVFGSGLGLVLSRHHLHSSLLIVHKASFYPWLATLLIHVAAHAKAMVRGTARDAFRRTRIEAGARTRRLAVTGSVLVGGGLALALARVAETYLSTYPHK